MQETEITVARRIIVLIKSRSVSYENRTKLGRDDLETKDANTDTPFKLIS
jgi:hypothetical protein